MPSGSSTGATNGITHNDPGPMAARSGRRTRNGIAAFVLLAIGATAGWTGARRAATGAAPPSAGGWQTATAERRDIGATVLATGVVRPRVGAQVAVGSRVSGILKRLHVTVGDRVTAGQMLAELDPVEFGTQVDRAEAMLRNAVAERTFAEAERARVRQLAERSVVTSAELDNAERAAETTSAREREAAAALESARIQLGYTRIRAPITGVVASVSTQEGETVAASLAAPTFLTIIDLSRLEVQAYIDETDIGRIEVGQTARFTVDTWPAEEFEGHVTAIRPAAELRDNVVNYITLIEITNRPGRLLRPEMTATVNITLDARMDALSVPNGSLRRDSGGWYVLVPGPSGLDRRAVDVGFRGSEFTELTSGIQPGDRVVVGSAQACEAPAGQAS